MCERGRGLLYAFRSSIQLIMWHACYTGWWCPEEEEEEDEARGALEGMLSVSMSLAWYLVVASPSARSILYIYSLTPPATSQPLHMESDYVHRDRVSAAVALLVRRTLDTDYSDWPLVLRRRRQYYTWGSDWAGQRKRDSRECTLELLGYYLTL